VGEQYVTTSTKLPSDLARRLRDYCRKRNITPYVLLRELIEGHLAREALSTTGEEDLRIKVGEVAAELRELNEELKSLANTVAELQQRVERLEKRLFPPPVLTSY
jgi:predicted nuclease with TOPRIM domain